LNGKTLKSLNEMLNIYKL